MRILLDARYLDGTFTGIGTYSLQLLRHLVRLEPANEYLVLVRPGFRMEGDWPRNVQFLTWQPAPVSYGTLVRLGSFVDTLRVDLMHSLFPLAPLRMKTPLMITVHDLQPFIDPDFSGHRPLAVQSLYKLFYRYAYPAAMEKARWILNVSYYTRDTVADLFPAFIPKLIVVQSGLDQSAVEPTSDDFELLADEHHLEHPYVIYYGSTRPNKNLPLMVRGFARYCRAHREEKTDLVLVLKKDRFFRDIPRIIRQEGLQHRVRIMEQLPLREQRTLLANARGFLFPTKYEGFGFPALEAMAARVPLIAGRSGALEEVCGGAALYVDVDDADGLAVAIAQIVHDEPTRERLIAAGIERSAKFDWNETAARVNDIYRLLF